MRLFSWRLYLANMEMWNLCCSSGLEKKKEKNQ